jgi:hypothetical protein
VKPATIRANAMGWAKENLLVWEHAKKTIRHGARGQPFTVAEDLLHGSFDIVGFDGCLWRLIQYTSVGGMSARRRKIDARFVSRMDEFDVHVRRRLVETTSVELWGYCGRRRFKVQSFKWATWAWSVRPRYIEAPKKEKRKRHDQLHEA